jgi:hypothetical protein
VGAGDDAGDRGQAPVALVAIGEALGQDLDEMELAVPVADQAGAGLESGGGEGVALGVAFEAGGELSQALLHLGREAAEGVLLEAVGEDAEEQVVAEPGRRRAAMGLGPERTQLALGERLQGGDLAADPGRSGLRQGQPGALVVDGQGLQPAWSGTSAASPDAPW